jgi:hypothetical protein
LTCCTSSIPENEDDEDDEAYEPPKVVFKGSDVMHNLENGKNTPYVRSQTEGPFQKMDV